MDEISEYIRRMVSEATGGTIMVGQAMHHCQIQEVADIRKSYLEEARLKDSTEALTMAAHGG